MWEIKELQNPDWPQACINGKWVPSRPENYKLGILPLRERLKFVWEVLIGKAETFKWPEGQ